MLRLAFVNFRFVFLLFAERIQIADERDVDNQNSRAGERRFVNEFVNFDGNGLIGMRHEAFAVITFGLN